MLSCTWNIIITVAVMANQPPAIYSLKPKIFLKVFKFHFLFNINSFNTPINMNYV